MKKFLMTMAATLGLASGAWALTPAIKIKRMVDPDLEGEAIRLVKQMPKWTPASDNGNPVESTAEIDVSFSLD